MAVRDVNLIESDVLMRRMVTRRLGLWSACMVLSLALVFGLYLYLNQHMAEQQDALADLKTVHANLAGKVEEIKQVQAQLENLKQQQAAIEARTRTRSYAGLLQHLAGSMNPDTWLTRLSIDSGSARETDSVCELTGYALSNDRLGDLLNHLSAQSIFSRVALKYAKEIKGRPLVLTSGRPDKRIEYRIDCNFEAR